MHAFLIWVGFIVCWVIVEIIVEKITGVDVKGWQGVLYRAVPYTAGVIVGYFLMHR
jgi:hypothetical protein